MVISVGDRLPEATFVRMGGEGPEEVKLSDLVNGRKVVIFGLPGAFTGTCTSAHLPSFIRTRDAFAAKGVDDVICVTVNDPFVTMEWSKATGADDGNVMILADPVAEYTKAIGMEFSAPPVGFYDRCTRHSMLVEDGVVKILKMGDPAGTCEITAGETLLADM